MDHLHLSSLHVFLYLHHCHVTLHATDCYCLLKKTATKHDISCPFCSRSSLTVKFEPLEVKVQSADGEKKDSISVDGAYGAMSPVATSTVASTPSTHRSSIADRHEIESMMLSQRRQHRASSLGSSSDSFSDRGSNEQLPAATTNRQQGGGGGAAGPPESSFLAALFRAAERDDFTSGADLLEEIMLLQVH